MHDDMKELNDKLVMVGLRCEYNHDCLRDRIAFLQEELDEMLEAHEEAGRIILHDLDPQNEKADMLDALVDIVVVAMGTAQHMNWNFETAWKRVHKANMLKTAVNSTPVGDRNMEFDLEKPFGWTAPYLQDLV